MSKSSSQYQYQHQADHSSNFHSLPRIKVSHTNLANGRSLYQHPDSTTSPRPRHLAPTSDSLPTRVQPPTRVIRKSTSASSLIATPSKMYANRRMSATSPAPPSPVSIARSSSAGGSHKPIESDSDVRNVRVVLRVRPSDPDDTSAPPRFRGTLVHPTTATEVRVDVDPATLIGQASGSTAGAKRHPTFTFDSVLGESSTQTEVYDATARETVDEFLNGHNVTFLAYGQTSSGKSYTMGTTGEDADYTGTEFTPRTGLIPRTVQTIFERAEEARIASGPGATWECRLSFLELYNEEIIDLLSGSGVQITIREDRDGRILWSGVREAKVRSLAEVMQHLYEGSARRKTGETGMNATSSRSHAIFSLTLVQKRRSVPLGDAPATPKQLRRPNSTIGVIAGTRSPTPSGSRPPPSAFAKTNSGLPRPNSYVAPPSDDFVVITSKFNMVDLAGSERLKRTAAQGERMKEGISINSGLLALGNVISTLADPQKAKGHVPFRDSKLTRMLQDSIGGNSLTTMIACVSPIEFNINETINTIKYASRARNIRNTTKVNTVEAGWDDVEHLQTLVTKLRKQVSEIDGGAHRGPRDDVASEKLLQRLAELQREHTELYDRYLAKTSENMRLTSELRNAKPGDEDAMEKFNEIVEPVILEYEKVVGALNKQLDELRAELTNISDLHEEQRAQLIEAYSRQSQDQSYVAELRGRVAKLTERNTSSEAYIQDLEAKLKSHSDKEDVHSESLSELRKEITRLKESNTELTRHTTELEARLSKSESHSTLLLEQIARYEVEAEARERAHRDLEKHVELLDTTKDNKLLLAEIVQKEAEIKALQGDLFEARAIAQRPPAALAVNPSLQAPVDPPTEVKCPDHDHSGEAALASRNVEVAQLEQALQELKDKYTDAEHQIADLISQLSEARLVHAEIGDVVPITPVTPRASTPIKDVPNATESTLQTPVIDSPSVSPSRHLHTRRGSLPLLSPISANTLKGRDFRGSRGFGEAKRARPQSLSQELSSAQLSATSPRNSWGPSHLRLTTSPSMQIVSLNPPKPSLRSSQSLEAELKYVHGVVDKRDVELRDREAYIRQLEETLRSHNLLPDQTSPKSISPGSQVDPADIPLPPSPTTSSFVQVVKPRDDSPPSTVRYGTLKRSIAELENGTIDSDAQSKIDNLLEEMATKESSQRSIIDQQFIQIADLQKVNNKLREELFEREPPLATILNEDEPLTPLKKEIPASHPPAPAPTPAKGTVDIEKLRQEHEESLKEKLKALAEEHATAMSTLRDRHDNVLQETQRQLSAAKAEQEAETAALKEEHARVLEEHKSSHESALTDLRKEHESAVEALKKTHEEAIAELKQSHAEAIAVLNRDSESLIEEMERSLAVSEEQRRQLKMKADQAAFEISRMKDESEIKRRGLTKQLLDLQRRNGQLEQARAERDGEIIDDFRYSASRRSSPMPPQGPPPTTPLPPLPAQSTERGHTLPALPITKDPSSDGARSSSTHYSTTSAASTAPTSVASIGDIAQLPEPIGQLVQKVLSERDVALSAKGQLIADLEKAKQAENRYVEEKVKADNLSRDLHDARKTNSKLRAHLEDARQEAKRVTEACAEHMEELNDRRNTMDRLSRESGQQRDSLVAANAQVANLKAQLDRAVEHKVNKKLNSRLKCF